MPDTPDILLSPDGQRAREIVGPRPGHRASKLDYEVVDHWSARLLAWLVDNTSQVQTCLANGRCLLSIWLMRPDNDGADIYIDKPTYLAALVAAVLAVDAREGE